MRRGVIFLSNVRCGSTHVVTTLGALPGCFADCEIKWRMPNLVSAAHLHLDTDAPSFTALLDGFDTDADFAGSKFILHPQNPLQEQDLALLKTAAQTGEAEGLSFVVLQRDYLDICASTLLRGNWNRLNAGNASAGSPSFRKTIAEFEATSLEQKHPKGETGSDGSGIKLDHMVNIVLQLLANDLIYHHMLEGLEHVFVQPYASLNADMPDVFKSIGVGAEGQAALPHLLKNPVVRKLKDLDQSQLPQADAFRAICAYAMGLREAVALGRLEPGDVFSQWARQDNTQLVKHLIESRLLRMIDRFLGMSL